MRRCLVAAGILAVLSFVAGVSGGCTFFGSAEESLAKLDSQLGAVEKNLDSVVNTLDDIGGYFQAPDRDQDWDEPDGTLMTAEQSTRLAQTHGRSNESTVTRLESGMRAAEKTLEDCPRTLLSSAQRERLASQEKRVRLLRKAVDAAKDALANSVHLRLIPALVAVLRDNDAAYASTVETLRMAMDSDDQSTTYRYLYEAMIANKRRLAPSFPLARSAVTRFGNQTEYDKTSEYLERLAERERMSKNLNEYANAVYYFNGDMEPVRAAYRRFADSYVEVTSLDSWENLDTRPSWFLQVWYGAKFGSQKWVVSDCLDESRELQQ